MSVIINGTTGITSPNLTFSGTGGRITGDFSNATWSSKVLFQSSTSNSQTAVGAIPNGTSTQTQFIGFNSTDPSNAAYIQAAITSTEGRLQTGQLGTGSSLPMTFYTGGGERMRIDTSGNLGLGVTPSAWNTGGYKALDFGTTSSLYYDPGTTAAVLSNNSYINSSYAYTYKTSTYATRYQQDSGKHIWYNAASGTAGNPITWTQAMTLDASGNLTVAGSVTSTGNTPQVTVYTSGSGTYTTPANCRYLIVEMVGGGGGGAGSGNAATIPTAGTGGTTTFGSSLLTCVGGGGGIYGSQAPAGGSATVNSPATSIVTMGGSRPTAGGTNGSGFMNGIGGATSPFGGSGGGGNNSAGTAAQANSGSGGGGAGTNSTNNSTGSGGASGGYIRAMITSPSATYSYAVGAAGTAGTAGTSGYAGAAGGSGVIIVTAYF